MVGRGLVPHQKQQLLSRLGLGTAQFGMLYGSFNQHGIPSHETVGAILKRARALGISVIDTARQYGESESVLGRYPDELAQFDVITKTPSFSGERITNADVQALYDGFSMSLDLLRLSQVEGLLVHQASNLLAPGGALLYKALMRLKEEGRARRIGVSAYSGEVVEHIMERFPIDLVQLPVNVLDRRLFQKGTLIRLAQCGIEIHARSVFLQGLLLTDPLTLPNHFDRVRATLTAFQQAAHAAGVSPAHAALYFVLGIPEISRVIIGVESLAQFEELVGQFPHDPCIVYDAFYTDIVDILDPRLWAREAAT